MAKVLVIGSGGREHALAWKLRQSDLVEAVYCASGNGGTAIEAENVLIKEDNFNGIAEFVREKDIILTVIGPEAPLMKGIVDFFEKSGLTKEGHLIFGPSYDAALLEGSKVFAKKFMRTNSIQTAGFYVFEKAEEAKEYSRSLAQNRKYPIVVKASGLAAGKGSIVCQTLDEAIDAIERIMVKKEFKESGDKIVIEEFMKGEEASILALTDGETILALASSQDHKPAFETHADRAIWLASGGDRRYEHHEIGPNTGGMGAYAPAPVVNDIVMKKVYDKILIPAINGMNRRETPFKGCLYAGLMIDNNEPNVIEFNVRLGDPEAQPVLSLLEKDFYVLLKACAEGKLQEHKIQNKNGAACCVVMASGGYPGKYETGKEIFGLEDAAKIENVHVFHAGTKSGNDGKVLTNGGRVLGVTGIGENIEDAIKAAYSGVKKISWENEYHRSDIGAKALNRK